MRGFTSKLKAKQEVEGWEIKSIVPTNAACKFCAGGREVFSLPFSGSFLLGNRRVWELGRDWLEMFYTVKVKGFPSANKQRREERIKGKRMGKWWENRISTLYRYCFQK